jgi:hypothetical protein
VEAVEEYIRLCLLGCHHHPLPQQSELHPLSYSWHQSSTISDRNFGFGVDPGRAFARIPSRTLGQYVVVTNPAPLRCRFNGFQRISVALQTTPEEPRQWNGPLGAPKRRPDPPQPAPPTRPDSCAAEAMALGPTGAPMGGVPRWRCPGRWRPQPRR